MENQINQLLAGQLSNFDDSELEKELEQLNGITYQLPDVPATPFLPEAPQGPVSLPAIDSEKKLVAN